MSTPLKRIAFANFPERNLSDLLGVASKKIEFIRVKGISDFSLFPADRIATITLNVESEKHSIKLKENAVNGGNETILPIEDFVQTVQRMTKSIEGIRRDGDRVLDL